MTRMTRTLFPTRTTATTATTTMGDDDEAAKDEDKAALDAEQRNYDEAVRRLTDMLTVINDRLESIGVRPVGMVAEFFELFAPDKMKKATEDSSVLFGLLMDFAARVRQHLPEKTWSWLPQMWKQWHWTFSNSWLNYKFAVFKGMASSKKKGVEQWAKWFGPNVPTLWINVLARLPFVRRKADGTCLPLDPHHVIDVMGKFHAGPSSVVTDGTTARVSGSKLWETTRLSRTANYERLLQLKAALLAQHKEWSLTELLTRRKELTRQPTREKTRHDEAAARDPLLRKNETLRMSLTAGQFCDLFPGDENLAEFISCAKVSLDFGQRKPFAGVSSCDDVCRPLHVRANVVNQKHGKFTQRERKEALLDELTRRYNEAHPVHGGGTAADALRVDKELWDEFERKSRESATPCCGATVPPPTRDVPLEFVANTQLRRDLDERKLGFNFEVVREARRLMVEMARWDQDVLCVVGGGKNFKGHGAAQVDTESLLNILRDHFLVIIVSEYNSSQRCLRCFGRSKFVWNGRYREKECKGCEQFVPRTNHERNGDFFFYFDRDVSAAVNFLSILCFMMRHGGLRPRAFAPDNAKDVYRRP